MNETSCEGCPIEFFIKLRAERVKSLQSGIEHAESTLSFCGLKDVLSGRKSELKSWIKGKRAELEIMQKHEPTQQHAEACMGPFTRTIEHPENGSWQQNYCGAEVQDGVLSFKISAKEHHALQNDTAAEHELPIIQDS